MKTSTLNFFYSEGKAATGAILGAENKLIEQRRQYALTLKALGRKRSLRTYHAFLQGYFDEVKRSQPAKEQDSHG
jgi:hypothetical protein